jgi:hypothetical protein
MQTPRHEIVNLLNFVVNEKRLISKNSYISLKNALEICPIPFQSVAIPKGKILYRTRVHLRNDFFLKISDLSHRLDLFDIDKFGRANEPLQSIFYCSDNPVVALSEVSKLIKEGQDLDYEITTTGIWEVQEDIRVGSIPINETIKGINTTADGLHEGFEDLLHKYYQNDNDLRLDILDIFSREFTKEANNDESNYLMSCAFANYIYDIEGTDTSLNEKIKAGGIIYTSVIHTEEGMNIALKPSFIEEKKLILVKAVRKVMKKINETTFMDIAMIETEQIDYDNNRIDW